MPADGFAGEAPMDALLQALRTAPGPVVLVGNEIGLGVIPLGREVRQFVDALGRLNQEVAALCARVTFMAAGLPLTLKDNR
jgi:adenosylcobinamide kinase/adenosylcobinamide-phosphate guanylyltransferase